MSEHERPVTNSEHEETPKPGSVEAMMEMVHNPGLKPTEEETQAYTNLGFVFHWMN